jgi:hypothetical protein
VGGGFLGEKPHLFGKAAAAAAAAGGALFEYLEAGTSFQWVARIRWEEMVFCLPLFLALRIICFFGAREMGGC